MKNRMTQKDADGIGALILMQKQRAIDYRGAVPNAGMAKRHEAFAETLAKAQAVLFGKIFYVFCLLLGMALAIVPLFLVLLDALPVYAGTFLAVLAAGLWGIAAAGTLVAAIASSTAVQGGLFSILLLPVILPLFLPAISLTSAAFGGGELCGAMLASMLCYDAAVTAGASILFDYVW